MSPFSLRLAGVLVLSSVAAHALPLGGAPQEAKLEDLAGGFDDRFGSAVAIDGDTAVVAAPRHAVGGVDSGAAYVYVSSGGGWSLEQVLVPNDAAPGQWFGSSVAVDGDTLLVGAYFDQEGGFNAGAAYVFTRSGATWTQQAKLMPSNAADLDWFGHGVALDGDRAVIGAPFKNTVGFAAGAAYVFERSGGAWTETWQLAPNDPAGNDFFGWQVALSGDTAAVAAMLQDTGGMDAGAAYVFTFGGVAWTQQAKLVASDAGAEDQLGSSIALDGDVLVAGAVNEDAGGSNAGAAYVFRRALGAWTEEQKLVASDPAADDLFGNSVSVAGDEVLVGAFHPDDLGLRTGAAYLYSYGGVVWTEQAKLVGADSVVDDWVGDGVATDGARALVGASRHQDRGAAYVFTVGGGFTAYCFGDGGGSPCPCGNESAPGAGEGCLNSSGVGARLAASGSTSAGADDLGFQASNLLPNQPALLFAGQNATGGGAGAPFGDGLRCAGQGVVRLGVRTPNAQGVATWGPGLGASGGWSSGDTRYFQAWYRDPSSGPCGSSFNLSHGVGVAFTD